MICPKRNVCSQGVVHCYHSVAIEENCICAFCIISAILMMIQTLSITGSCVLLPADDSFIVCCYFELFQRYVYFNQDYLLIIMLYVLDLICKCLLSFDWVFWGYLSLCHTICLFEKRSYHAVAMSVHVSPSKFSRPFFNMLWDINFKLGIYIQYMARHVKFELHRNRVMLTYFTAKSISTTFFAIMDS